jgi:predicted AAA+ superfamily ATPase
VPSLRIGFYGDLESRGIAIAKDTLHSYLAYLEDAFLDNRNGV